MYLYIFFAINICNILIYMIHTYIIETAIRVLLFHYNVICCVIFYILFFTYSKKIYIYIYIYLYILITLLNAHQLKRVYALNLSILVSAAQQQKLSRIPLVTASELGNTVYEYTFIVFRISPTI
jgi:hypothetical protein